MSREEQAMVGLPQAVVSKPRFFYGWVIVGVSFLAQFGGTLTGNYGLTVLLVPMSEDTGWTRAQIIGVNIPASITAAIVSPFFGRIADRYGARAPMALAALLGGLTIMGVAFVHHLWVYYLIFGLVNGISRPMVQVIGISQGVAQWFVRRRSAAAGWVSSAIPISGLIGIQLSTMLLLRIGWRGTWAVLGAILVILVAAPVWFLWKPSPESMGLQPDGDPAPRPAGTTGSPVARSVPRRRGRFSYYQTDVEFTVGEAVRTRAFWVTAIVLPIIALTGPAFATNVIAYFLSRGLSAQGAAFASTSFVFGTFVARLVWGYLGAHLHVQYCYVLLGLVATIGTVLILISPNVQMAYAAVVFFGLAGGGLLQLRLLIYPGYFGRQAIGTLRGYTAPFELLGGTMGPFFAAWVFDQTGSYDGALAIYAAISAVSVLIILFFGGPPRPPVRPAPPSAAALEAAPAG